MSEIRTVNVTRYVTPLREGGSLPAIVEADDDGLYVLKFRGAGQGAKALIAELIAGEIARAAGFRVPEIVFANLDKELSRTEPDPEIQDLMKASAGLNLALDYLPGSITFDPVVNILDGSLASKIVWFDAFIMNVDRTPRNPNMLMWHKELWLIDHGASLYFHHSWDDWKSQSTRPFSLIKDHVLLPFADDIAAADAEMSRLLTPELFANIIDLIPDGWLDEDVAGADDKRRIYRQFLETRVQNYIIFTTEAVNAAKKLV